METDPTFSVLVSSEEVVSIGGFYGAVNNTFQIGDLLYEAIEDENDGYRSMCEELVVSKPQGTVPGLFSVPLDQVKLVSTDETLGANWSAYVTEGYQVVSVEDGHVWLTLGTNHSDDYYPTFVFNYTPRPGPKEEVEEEITDATILANVKRHLEEHLRMAEENPDHPETYGNPVAYCVALGYINRRGK